MKRDGHFLAAAAAWMASAAVLGAATTAIPEAPPGGDEEALLLSQPAETKVAPAASTEVPAAPAAAPKAPEAPPKEPAAAPAPRSEDTSLSAQFRTASELLQQADDAVEKEKWADAARLYDDALNAYKRLVRQHPEWEPGVSRFRIAYCENKVAEMLKKAGLPVPADEMAAPASRTNTPTPPQPPRPAVSSRPAIGDIAAAAKAFLREGKGQDARGVLMEGLRRDPDNRDVRLLIGMAQCQVGKFSDAAHVLEPLIEEKPADAHARVVLGSAYFGLGRFEEARREMETALRHDARLSEAHYNLAQILMVLTPPDREKALEHYRRSVELGAPADPTLEERLDPMGPPAEPAPASPIKD